MNISFLPGTPVWVKLGNKNKKQQVLAGTIIERKPGTRYYDRYRVRVEMEILNWADQREVKQWEHPKWVDGEHITRRITDDTTAPQQHTTSNA